VPGLSTATLELLHYAGSCVSPAPDYGIYYIYSKDKPVRVQNMYTDVQRVVKATRHSRNEDDEDIGVFTPIRRCRCKYTKTWSLILRQHRLGIARISPECYNLVMCEFPRNIPKAGNILCYNTIFREKVRLN